MNIPHGIYQQSDKVLSPQFFGKPVQGSVHCRHMFMLTMCLVVYIFEYSMQQCF